MFTVKKKFLIFFLLHFFILESPETHFDLVTSKIMEKKMLKKECAAIGAAF